MGLDYPKLSRHYAGCSQNSHHLPDEAILQIKSVDDFFAYAM